MKRFLTTILALVYLTASNGATIHLHYCMGKLMSWDLSRKQEAKCGICGMGKKGHRGCCKDEQKVLQIEKDQKASKFSFQFLNISSSTVSVTYAGLPFVYPSAIVVENPTANAPPRPGKVPLFIRNRVFRI